MAQINPWILGYEAKSYANGDYSNCRVDCSLGVNLETPPTAVTRALEALSLEELQHYPHDPEFLDALAERFAPRVRLGRENFALGCGSVDILYTVNKLFLAPGKTVVGYAPQFSAYVDDVHMQGAEYAPFMLRQPHNYRLDADAFAAFIDAFPRAVHVVYVDNPNNPTGQVLRPEEIKTLIQAAARRDAAILVDEAYGEFMPEEYSAMRFVGQYDHLYVLKSMSKGFGLAGMRLGYIAGAAEGMAQYRKLVPPYNGNGLARRLGVAMLRSGESGLEGLISRAAAKNRQLYALLAGGPIRVAHTEPSVPISLLYTDDPGVDLCEVFRKAGVATVSGASFEGLGVNSVRLMLPREEEMPLLLELADVAQKSLSAQK